MALLDVLLGKENPAAQWANRNSGLLTGLGTSLLSDGMNFAPAAQGSAMDRQAAQQREADAKLAASTNATIDYFARKYPDLAEKARVGAPVSELWQEAMARDQAAMYPAQPQNPYMSAGDGQFFNWQTGDFVANPNAAPDAPNLPTSYQEFQLAQSDPAYAASLSSSSTKPPTEGERRNQQLATVIKPELATVENNWKALTDAGNQVAGSDLGGNRPGLAFTSPEYQQAINSLSTIVASYLYSVSGATATDEEIKRQVNLLTPKLGESEQSANQKLDRIRTYAAAVEAAAGRAANQPGVAAGAADPLGIR
ncbi:MAG: hypothetical protein EOO12_00200 [Chitinophagaceae bacterium]|nr:MAG: hypothetical protein EOO12_00200 [Chitinophagaceae bacterium]